MLQQIHEKIQGWVAGLIVFIIAAAFLVWGLQYYLNSSSQSAATAAVVNGAKISKPEVDQLYTRLADQYRQFSEGGALSLQEQKHLRHMAIQQLITRTIIYTHAKKLGLAISSHQLAQQIVGTPMFQVNGAFSAGRYQQILAANSLTPASYQAQLKQQLMASQLHQAVAMSNFALPAEVVKSYQLFHQTRDFGYAVISSHRFKHLTINRDQIKQYYQANLDQFQLPAQVKIQYILLSPNNVEKTVRVTTAQAKQYYQQHKTNFMLPKQYRVKEIKVTGKDASEKMAEIVKKLQSGVAFSQVAQSKEKTIDLYKAMAPLQTILPNMKPGQISIPFASGGAHYLVKLSAIIPSQQQPFSKVRDQIEKGLHAQQVQQAFSKKADQLSNLTYTNPNSLQTAAKALGVSVKTSDWFTQDGKKKGLLSKSKVVQAAFSKDVMGGNNSQLINLDNGDILVLRVSEHQSARTQTLSEVEKTIVAKLKQEAASNKAANLASDIASSLQSGQPAKTIMAKYHLAWKVKSHASRSVRHVPSEVVMAVYHANLTSIDQQVADVALDNGDYAVVKLYAIHSPDASGSKKQSGALRQEMSSYLGQTDYQLYLANLHRQAKVKVQ